MSLFQNDPDAILSELHRSSDYVRQPRRIRRILDKVLSDLVKKILQSEARMAELLIGPDVMKTFLPQDIRQDDSAQYPVPYQLNSTSRETAVYSFYCWQDSYDGSGGAFFNIRETDDRSVVLYLGHAVGSGVVTGLNVALIHALCTDYLNGLHSVDRDSGKAERNGFENLLFRANDVLNSTQFRGRFVLLQLLHISNETGEVVGNHAGSNLFRRWRSDTHRLEAVDLGRAPALGQIDSMMIEMQNERIRMAGSPDPAIYSDTILHLEEEDILFFMTDGYEQSTRHYRNEDGQEVRLQDLPVDLLNNHFPEEVFRWYGETEEPDLYNHCRETGNWIPFIEEMRTRGEMGFNPQWEEFGETRIHEIITASLTSSSYVLKRQLDLLVPEPLVFDFSGLEPTPENAVLAVAAVAKVFRLVPAPDAGESDIIRVDRKIESFLERCFRDFHRFYRNRIPDSGKPDPQYSFYSHLREDPQNDDFILMAYQRRRFVEEEPSGGDRIPDDGSSMSDPGIEILEELEAVNDETELSPSDTEQLEELPVVDDDID